MIDLLKQEYEKFSIGCLVGHTFNPVTQQQLLKERRKIAQHDHSLTVIKCSECPVCEIEDRVRRI